MLHTVCCVHMTSPCFIVTIFCRRQWLDYTLKIFNYFFTSVFILELLAKLIAMSPRRYVRDK